LELFTSSQEWATHELSHQQSSWADFFCPFCGRNPDSLNSKLKYLKHVAEHLREVSLAPLAQFVGEDKEGDDDESEHGSSISWASEINFNKDVETVDVKGVTMELLDLGMMVSGEHLPEGPQPQGIITRLKR